MGFSRCQQSPTDSCTPQLLNIYIFTVLRPLVISGAIDDILTFVFSISQPVRFQDSASVGSITAEAALCSLGEVNPSLVVNSDVVARSANIWQDRPAEGISHSIVSVHTFSVIFGIIEYLSVVDVSCVIVRHFLLESDVVVVVENWRGGSEKSADESQKHDDLHDRLNRFISRFKDIF